jgi:hypothetical protein
MLSALIAMCIAALMVQAGVAKRQLAWRSRRVNLHARRPVLIVPPVAA